MSRVGDREIVCVVDGVVVGGGAGGGGCHHLLLGMVTRSVSASSLLSKVKRELCSPATSALHLHFSQQSQ